MNDYIKQYAQYMGVPVDEVLKLIKSLQTETYNVLSYSYGKDSGACLVACESLGIPIHAIITADVWATDDIPADLPPMVEFKAKADAIIKERYGIEVQHICAMTTAERKHNPFFQKPQKCVGGINAHTKIFCTEEFNQNEQSNETENIAINKKKTATSTDSLADKNLGATQNSKLTSSKTCKLTYEDLFYRTSNAKISRGGWRGFPTRQSQYCTSDLKNAPLRIPKCQIQGSILYRRPQTESAKGVF